MVELGADLTISLGLVFVLLLVSVSNDLDKGGLISAFVVGLIFITRTRTWLLVLMTFLIVVLATNGGMRKKISAEEANDGVRG